VSQGHWNAHDALKLCYSRRRECYFFLGQTYPWTRHLPREKGRRRAKKRAAERCRTTRGRAFRRAARAATVWLARPATSRGARAPDYIQTPGPARLGDLCPQLRAKIFLHATPRSSASDDRRRFEHLVRRVVRGDNGSIHIAPAPNSRTWPQCMRIQAVKSASATRYRWAHGGSARSPSAIEC